MLEAAIAVASLVIGFFAGWRLRAKSTPSADPQKAERLENDLRDAQKKEAGLQARLESLQERFEAEKKRLEEVRKAMEDSFKAMASDIAKSNSESFMQQATAQFKNLREGSEKDLDEKKKLIDKSLTGMNEKLDNIHKQSTELKSSLDTSRLTTEKLREDTTRLREILSSSQQRGQWGERMVTDILQVIGLRENINYTRQAQVESGERPDFTFLLPRDKKLNMDVKFPLARYENFLAASDDAERAAQKTAFLSDVRKHVKAVSSREYINTADGTLEYVMLFIPNESIYGFINNEDAALVDYALANHVLLCSPLTLYAVLSLIHQAAHNFILNERASEVMSLVAKFREQWKKYIVQMDKLGKRIEGLSGDYQMLVTTRTRALERPLDKIENLSLPSEIELAEPTSDEAS